MQAGELKAAMKNGERVYGTLVVSPSPKWPEQIARLGLDFVFIDTEHIAIDRHQLSWMCQAYTALNIAPIVRIPSPDPFQAAMVMDAGAAGVIAPYVETVEQVKALRGAVKFRPLKGQKLQQILNDSKQPRDELGNYLTQHNQDNLLIVNIESTPAMQALDDILKVPDLDGVLIGPHDISCSLEIPEQYRHPKFEEAVRTIFRKARANNVSAGIHYWTGTDQQIRWAKEDGLNFIIHSSDLNAVVALLNQELTEIKGALGDQVTTANTTINI